MDEVSTQGRHRWTSVMQQCYAAPGEWVRVVNLSQPTASKVRNSQVVAVRNFLDLVGGHVEVRYDGPVDRNTKADAWVRWVGVGEGASESQANQADVS